MCELAGEAMGCAATDVLVCSTGLIGIPMPMSPFTTGIPAAAAALAATPEAGRSAAEGIMTTDTVAKEAIATFEVGGCAVTVGGMAKGAAMLSPAMATMLAVITTDALVVGASGNKSKVIAITDYSDGNDKIIGEPGVDSVKALKGKKVAVELTLVDHLLMLQALSRA